QSEQTSSTSAWIARSSLCTKLRNFCRSSLNDRNSPRSKSVWSCMRALMATVNSPYSPSRPLTLTSIVSRVSWTTDIEVSSVAMRGSKPSTEAALDLPWDLAYIIFCSAERNPYWNQRVRIALDVAKGILYLHDECEPPILHCDIKPQNILMDEFWTAKISDFGLAKLLSDKGCMAPECYKRTPISVKADVYGYGIVLLETICCWENMEIDASKPEEIILTNWVYKCFINRELNKLVRGTEVDKKNLENLVKVGLWCVQDEPALRPSMKCVVMML
ncbi:hypothetical protein CISIN_1g048314mg, partial [Citrus sinensis]